MSEVVNFRFKAADHRRMVDLAKSEGVNVSDYVRRAVHEQMERSVVTLPREMAVLHCLRCGADLKCRGASCSCGWPA